MMSDSSSDDELANNDTSTTPFRATKHILPTLKSSKAKANGRLPPNVSVAGPSSAQPSTQQRARQRGKRTPSPVQVEEDDVELGQDEHAQILGNAMNEPIMIDVEPPKAEVPKAPSRATRGTRSTKRAESREPESLARTKTSRAAPRVKGNGKATTRRKYSPSTVDIESTDNARGEDSDVFAQSSETRLQNELSKGAGSSGASEREFLRVCKENELLRTRVEELTRQRNNIVFQFEELSNLRHTESELNLEQLKKNYESRIKAQEEAIAELTSSSELVKALQLDGKISMLQYLSYEAAAAEQLPLRNEIDHLKGIIERKGKDSADSEERVKQLQNTVKTLQSDLQTEIENSKRLSSTSTKKIGRNDDHKHGWVTKLYEDMSNFLVISVREEEVGDITGEPEMIYVCVYSTNEAKGGAGLTFSLRIFKSEDDDGASKEKCLYSPKDLDREGQEFIDGLGFLSDTFTFWKSQIAVFYDRLKSTMSEMAAHATVDG